MLQSDVFAKHGNLFAGFAHNRFCAEVWLANDTDRLGTGQLRQLIAFGLDLHLCGRAAVFDGAAAAEEDERGKEKRKVLSHRSLTSKTLLAGYSVARSGNPAA